MTVREATATAKSPATTTADPCGMTNEKVTATKEKTGSPFEDVSQTAEAG
jgi:hypothetical protein